MIPSSGKSKKRKNKRRISIISLCSIFLLIIVLSIYIGNTSIKITHHTMESEKISSPVRLAVISDLHSKVFPNKNRELLQKLEESKPDIILAVGDIISKHKTSPEDTEYLSDFISALYHIAPVYYALGNHELSSPILEDIKTAVTNAGGIIIDGEYADISIHDNNIRLSGLSHYRSWDEETNGFIADSLETEETTFSILMCHYPEFYLWGIRNHPIDLAVSGHTHGGMVNIPFLGPLYAPEQGWFPEYAAGFYQMEKGYLAVTTGLSSSPEYMPRIFNRPEIMIIDVM